MGGGDLNTKKAWHPNTMKNQERVWKAEQAAAEEKKRIQELQREREEERDRAQLNEMAQRNFGTSGSADNRLHWMYDNKPDRQTQQEDYLLGKAIGKSEGGDNSQQNAIPAVSRRVVGSSMLTTGDDTQVDLARKLREDPLLLVKERERAARAALLNNPLQRKKLADLLRKEQEQKEMNAKKKSKKKGKDLDDVLAAKLNALGGKKGIDLNTLLKLDDDSSYSSSSDEKCKKKKKKRKSEKTKSKKKKRKQSDSDSESSDDEKDKKRSKKNSKKEKKSSKSHKTEKIVNDSDIDSSDDNFNKKNKSNNRNNKAATEKRRHDDDSEYITVKYRRSDISPDGSERRDWRNSIEINSRHERNSTREGERRMDLRDDRRVEVRGELNWRNRERERSPRRDSKRSSPPRMNRDERNKKTGLSSEEKAARLAEMAAAGHEREVEREKRVARSRAADAAESRAPRLARNNVQALPTSLEDRIRSNRHYIQRDRLHMNEHFARR